MNKLYPYEPFGTMPLYRSSGEDMPQPKIRSGWSRLHSIPEYYPSQTRIYKELNDYYKDPYTRTKPAQIKRGDYTNSIMEADLLRWKGQQETLGATQLINVKQQVENLGESNIQEEIAKMPNQEEIFKAIQVFESKLSAINLTPAKKQELRNEFYKKILNADIETVFKIAKDEQGKNIQEILDLVRNINIGDDNADLGLITKEDQEKEQESKDDELALSKEDEEKAVDDDQAYAYYASIINNEILRRVIDPNDEGQTYSIGRTFKQKTLSDILTGQKKATARQKQILDIFDEVMSVYYQEIGRDFETIPILTKFNLYNRLVKEISKLQKQ